MYQSLRLKSFRRWVGRKEGAPIGPSLASVDHGQDVVLAHQEDLLVAEGLELLARVRGEQDLVADLHLQLAALAVLGGPALAHGQDLALLRLVLGSIGQHDPTGGLLPGLFPLDHHAIAQWLEIHRPGLLAVQPAPGKPKDFTSPNHPPRGKVPAHCLTPRRHASVVPGKKLCYKLIKNKILGNLDRLVADPEPCRS